MKVIALSDIHGRLPKPVDPCDLLIVAGDVCPMESHEPHYQRNWLKDEFTDWLNAQPAEKIVGIGGNHDFIMQKEPWVPRNLPWIYLRDSAWIDRKHGWLKVYGSPWVPNLPDWAFYGDDVSLQEAWDKIPDDTDILVTHGPPSGILDLTGSMFGKMRVGCPKLTSAVTYRVKPRLHIFGHIHEAHGTFKPNEDGTEYANVSLLNEMYEPSWDATTLRF